MDSDWNIYDNLNNVISYESSELFGAASDDLVMQVQITVLGCVEEIMFDASVNSGTTACEYIATTGVNCINLLENNIVSFEGETAGKNNLLTWTIDKEEETIEYVIEKSKNAIESNVISTKKALGLSEYNFIDKSPYGQSYYRLKCIHIDESFDYSDWILVERKELEANFVVYPNPILANLTIDFLAEESYSADIIITDVLGRVISVQTVKTEIGVNRQTISMSALPPAMYTLTFGNRQQNITRKITKI
jgi:hypothetical protein